MVFHLISPNFSLAKVTKKPSLGGQVWADGSIYAVGDCNYGCIGEPGNWEMPPVPKISYPGAWAWEVMDDDLVVKPMVTWGILGIPHSKKTLLE